MFVGKKLPDWMWRARTPYLRYFDSLAKG